jgi:hypothetical protein
MSLQIDITKIMAVLLSDGWHHVINGTFDLDAYELGVFAMALDDMCRKRVWEYEPTHRGGESGVCATGFTFKTYAPEGFGNGGVVTMTGPMTSILATMNNHE